MSQIPLSRYNLPQIISNSSSRLSVFQYIVKPLVEDFDQFKDL